MGDHVTSCFLRLCNELLLFMRTISQNDTYLLPCIDDIFASLAICTIFSKVDQAHGYQQIPLDDTPNSTILSTHTKASIATIVCPFMCPHHALSSNEQMENILHDLSQVCVYIDDILVTGRTEDEHMKNKECVLSHLEEAAMVFI